jgi:hypothetical protein
VAGWLLARGWAASEILFAAALPMLGAAAVMLALTTHHWIADQVTAEAGS